MSFKTFPAFSKLSLEDREEYEKYVEGYPPLSDLSFSTLMMWWNLLGGLAVAQLNGGLVISYWIPGDEKHSGLSFIGTENVDESICTIFDYQRERGEKSRLVNVPEFVINNMQYPEMFAFKSGRGDDEYLLSVSKFAKLENMPTFMRHRAQKFIQETTQATQKIQVKSLKVANSWRQMLAAAERWPLKGVNNVNKLEREVLAHTLSPLGAALDVRGVALFVDGSLEAYCLYFPTPQKDCVIIAHARINYDRPRLFEYTVHAFSAFFERKGITRLNIHADNDSLKLRALKIALKPENFFRKYALEPSK